MTVSGGFFNAIQKRVAHSNANQPPHSAGHNPGGAG